MPAPAVSWAGDACIGEFRQALDRLLELLRQVAIAGDAVAFASVERVLAAPVA